MKKIITCIIVILVECLLIYLLFVCMLEEFNTSKWSEGYRGICITLQFIFSILTVGGMFTDMYKS